MEKVTLEEGYKKTPLTKCWTSVLLLRGLKMGRYSSVRIICSLLILLACWPAFSNGASLTVEDKLQQLADNYAKFKEIMGTKMVQLEKKIIELDAVNVEHGLRYTQLEEQVTQLEESVTLQLKNQNPQLQMEAGEDLASKVLQLEAKVPQQETLMIALNHILKLKQVVGEKMSELGEKDSQLETRMNELEQKDSQLETKLSELQSREVLKRILELDPGTQQEESSLQSLQQESLKSNVPYNIPTITRSSGKSGNPRTCKEIHSNDPSSPSGMYWIDPDGQGVGDDSIYVHCDMTTGTTSVPHDSESPTNVGHCAEPGCYSRTIRYNATSKQLSALAELSIECHQSIVYDCNYAPFEFNNVPYAWWNDRNGDPHYYWAGSATDVHSCQCSIDQNCVDGTAKCNCDSISPTQLTDAGFITDKKLLPVTGLNFGRTHFEISSGVHTLGRFQCSGQATISGMPKSCEDLWRIGHSLNGVYSVVGSAMMESVYCDFTKLPEDPGFQKWIGYADVKSVPTYFYVQRSDRFSKVNVSIPFDVALVNIGNAMNLTTGVFTAPRAGTYYFSFTGLAEFPTFSSLLYLGVDLYLNGNLIGRGFVEDQNTVAGQFTPVTLHSTLNLLPGDQIWLQIDSLLPPLIGDGTAARRKRRMLPTKGVILFDDYRHFTHFTGLMLEEDISQSL